MLLAGVIQELNQASRVTLVDSATRCAHLSFSVFILLVLHTYLEIIYKAIQKLGRYGTFQV